ncbi:hypothetical protein IF2G_08841 [Cordyceps javanica]|nr:hypothetical protein IF2G_08841 [Cordyceps javanica]
MLGNLVFPTASAGPLLSTLPSNAAVETTKVVVVIDVIRKQRGGRLPTCSSCGKRELLTTYQDASTINGHFSAHGDTRRKRQLWWPCPAKAHNTDTYSRCYATLLHVPARRAP